MSEFSPVKKKRKKKKTKQKSAFTALRRKCSWAKKSWCSHKLRAEFYKAHLDNLKIILYQLKRKISPWFSLGTVQTSAIWHWSKVSPKDVEAASTFHLPHMWSKLPQPYSLLKLSVLSSRSCRIFCFPPVFTL